MPPESRPTYLDIMILTAVKFGRNHGCKLDGHLACKTDTQGIHIELTVDEVVSAVTMEGYAWLATTLEEKSSTLSTIEEVEEGLDGQELTLRQKKIEISDGNSDTVADPDASSEDRPGSDLLENWVDEETSLLPSYQSERAVTPLSLPTTFTGHPSTFSGVPGPGYIMGKALYWTGNRVIAAFEMFNINSRVRNHMEILRSKRSPSRNSSPQYDMLFQILDDALELSKPYYANFVNKYSIRLYNEYVKFLRRRPFPREFFQTISSAMLTLSNIAWISYQNYPQEFPFVRELIKICTERPVRLHDSDEISATQRVLAPHLARIIPHYLYRRLSFLDLDENTFKDFWFGPMTTSGVALPFSTGAEERSSAEPPLYLYSFISSFPWLAVAVYDADHEKDGDNFLACNILADIESFLVVKESGWAASLAWIEAYCSLICTGIKTLELNYLLLDEIVRDTFSRLYAMVAPHSKRKRWRFLKEDPVRIAGMEVLLELLIWMRCELEIKTEPGPIRYFMITLSELGLSNISLLAEKYLSSCKKIPRLAIEVTVERIVISS